MRKSLSSTIETRVLQVGELSLQLHATSVTAGAGTPVMALHGWGASSELMLPVLERLERLGYAAYAPDLPGFGASSVPPTTWSVFDYAKLIVQLLDVLELPSAHLIGHSFGGRLGLILGADYAERMERLVLVDSAGVPNKSPLHAQIRLKTYKSAREVLNGIGARSAAKQLSEWYRERYGSSDYKNTGALREVFVRVVNEDLLPYARRVGRPTLLVWGSNDEDTPLWQGQMLEKAIPDAGLVTLKGAGHYSYLERINEFVTFVDHFFKSAP